MTNVLLNEESHSRNEWVSPITAFGLVLFLLLLPLLALISIPLFWVYPDRHMNQYDFEGTPRQKARLAQWRATYDRLGLRGRIRRARTRQARRRRLRAAQHPPLM